MRVHAAALLLAASTAYGFVPSIVRAPPSLILLYTLHMLYELNCVNCRLNLNLHFGDISGPFVVCFLWTFSAYLQEVPIYMLDQCVVIKLQLVGHKNESIDRYRLIRD